MSCERVTNRSGRDQTSDNDANCVGSAGPTQVSLDRQIKFHETYDHWMTATRRTGGGEKWHGVDKQHVLEGNKRKSERKRE
ncbi:hypothetical protein GN958_ATG23063 [Phytophthora infestans]|uniref:Uncharacterized protein n=1 Tax=Phytophthora infestans TaxID=4787 RepID=A0A8S9TJU7_PHYIN|nr:hypothetical protein GN958_ATG23063 [Phytophthora infestans]